MPTPTITHKSWCREHQTDYEGEHCYTGGFEFGPMRPTQPGFPARTEKVTCGAANSSAKMTSPWWSGSTAMAGTT
jgi:hypothetical protein